MSHATPTYVTVGERARVRVSPPCYFSVPGNVPYCGCCTPVNKTDGEEIPFDEFGKVLEFHWQVFRAGRASPEEKNKKKENNLFSSSRRSQDAPTV